MKYSSSSSSATLLALLMATVQGSPLNFPGSSVVSLSSRVPKPCLTTAGDTCVFPFSYLGVEYYQCTYTRCVTSLVITDFIMKYFLCSSPTPWCATKVDP